MEIRYITPTDDIMAISRIYEESWKYTYKGLIPQHYLESIPEGRWVANLENPNWSTLVCVDNGRIVGTSSFCESHFSQFSGKKMGYRNIFVWVLEENLRARKFYEKEGFVMTDVYLDDNIGGKDVREIRYIYREK